jgi:hypothetical protein
MFANRVCSPPGAAESSFAQAVEALQEEVGSETYRVKHSVYSRYVAFSCVHRLFNSVHPS